MKMKALRYPLVLVILLGVSFTVLSLHAVNDHVVVPWTECLTAASAVVLDPIVPGLVHHGTRLQSPGFAVNVKNGCNGIEAMLVYLAAVLVFPVSWKGRAIGVGLGLLVLPIVNLLRIVALFLTGLHAPGIFATSHTVIWQTVVLLVAVLLWIFWAGRFGGSSTREVVK